MTDTPRHPDDVAAPDTPAVGTGVGAVAGAAAGAAIGSVAGPLGTGLGAVVGAIVGGFTGKEVGGAVDTTVHDDHWRSHYEREPYYRAGHTYDDYAPAYGLGIGSLVADKYRERDYDEIEPELARDWEIYRGESRLNWPEASPAARAAWQRARRDVGAV
ncbi:glycine zipper domain-containing protein [Ottowia sp. SB7-C50]|uniref:glycine zipper domain-containing protein n=1 Tax=Ottowia sp. SB7-C50 TaxID=3081231 RepID=UPI002955C812|nr:glycine zipper domain-containing protein [Ottowia sp. SB7-C50]WOP14334.1 glycine zipper domain-containing protein [Ottowia sp. SB7-C50]